MVHEAELMHVKNEAEKIMDAKEKKGGRRSMSTTEYRPLLVRRGMIEPDQHVCHIISKANGGADHPDNYAVFGEKYNMSSQDRHDDYTCFIVGLIRATAAVDISRKYGNKKGQKYEGPDAATLVANGARKQKLFNKSNSQQPLPAKP